MFAGAVKCPGLSCCCVGCGEHGGWREQTASLENCIFGQKFEEPFFSIFSQNNSGFLLLTDIQFQHLS